MEERRIVCLLTKGTRRSHSESNHSARHFSLILEAARRAAVLLFLFGLGICPAIAQAVKLAATNGTNDPLCTVDQNGITNVVQPAGTRRMVEMLSKLRKKEEQNPGQTAFINEELAALLERRLLEAVHSKDMEEAFRLQPQWAVELLYAGQSEKALQVFAGLLQNLQKTGKVLKPEVKRGFWLSRALCYMRLGEQENCLTNHTIDSCLVPIGKGGFHKLPRGSQGAIAVLSELLTEDEKDLDARWLLNIAYMTLGEYPDKVPPKWLIPPKVFESDYDIKRFPDIAGEVGLDVDGLAGGSIAEDFDGDGNLDLMVSNWNLKGQLRFFRNNGDGTFTERTIEAGLKGLTGGLQIMQTDYNNDGFPDVYVMRGAWLGAAGHEPKSLLRNNGNGTFEDVTESAGLLSLHPSQTATWFDFDGDGWLDVFIGNETTPTDTNPCELYHNNHDGTFTECAEEVGVAVTRFVKGVTSGDYNNDGRPDLYLSTRNGPNILFRNDGPSTNGGKWKFTDVAAHAGVTEPMTSFPTWFWDFNNDGLLDIMVTGYSISSVGDIAADYLGLPHNGEKARLYKNNGNGTFSDVTVSARLDKLLHAMGANFGDLDNDGWLDFYLGTGDPDLRTIVPNRMFRNVEGKFFQDVTTSGGFGHIQKGHGISFADFDNDGDQDIFEVIGGAYTGDHYRSVLFRNPGHGNHWITLKLEGVRSNRAAIGARIRVIVETPEGERSIYKTVGTGASFGASPLRQEIGLGLAKSIRAVEIFWPATGKTQVVKGLMLDHFYKIREGEDVGSLWALKSFPFPSLTAFRGHSHEHQAATASE